MAAFFTMDGFRNTARTLGFTRTGYCRSQAKLIGKTVVITGGNTGIGLQTALDLWRRGANVMFTCRDHWKGETAVQEIKANVADKEERGFLRFTILDLASFDSVRRCARHLLSTLSSIDILINNAGVMQPPFELTESGFELQFGANYLGHALLTFLLLPKILESSPARIVNLSSVAHRFYDTLDLDTMNDPNKYYGLHAYFRSKASIVIFSRELAKRLEGTGVNVYSLNPGYVTTKLYKYGDETMFSGFSWLVNNIAALLMKDPWAGAQNSIHCAVCEKAQNETGLYYDECRPVKLPKLCVDENVSKDLWDKTLVWLDLGLNYDIFRGGSGFKVEE